jgi:2-oxoglutarate dehydrogenase complex dehydrogenase (E1) component-like enzyme
MKEMNLVLQPLLYKIIKQHKNPRDLYAKIIVEGVIDIGFVKNLR